MRQGTPGGTSCLPLARPFVQSPSLTLRPKVRRGKGPDGEQPRGRGPHCKVVTTEISGAEAAPRRPAGPPGPIPTMLWDSSGSLPHCPELASLNASPWRRGYPTRCS